MVTTFDRGGPFLVTRAAPGAYVVHSPDQRPVEGVAAYHYERNNAWVCEVHGANHANTSLDCQHIRAAREIRK